MAFLSAPEVPWLYSGVTKTYPSNEAMAADQSLVCGWLYEPDVAGMGSSRSGSSKVARSRRAKSASVRFRAISYAHLAPASAFRPGRVLPTMMAILIIAYGFTPPGRRTAPRWHVADSPSFLPWSGQ